jgi:catechol 2,3-dioxygenase-like lactoylglutathione lyase family enzyme
LNRNLGLISIVVRDYDEAISFYVKTLGFELLEDTDLPDEGKRWVVVSPGGDGGAHLLLARASNAEQQARIGDQTGGRVFLFLYTDDFKRDYDSFRAQGVEFVRGPNEFSYGTVAVFKDICGNLWDLVQPKHGQDDGKK